MTHVVAVVLLPLGTGETARLNALRETVGVGLPVAWRGRGVMAPHSGAPYLEGVGNGFKRAKAFLSDPGHSPGAAGVPQ